jgi:hypothetical protein
MDPLSVAALISAGTGLFKGVMGGFQAHNASNQIQRLERNRPEYDVPTSIENLDEVPDMYADYLAQLERTQTLPGQERMEQQIRESTAQSVSEATKRARTSTEALGAATKLYSDELEQIQQLEIESARQRARQKAQARQMYGNAAMQAGQLQAQYEDQQFRLNQMEPFMWNMREAQQRQQAGYNMIGSAFDDAANAAQLFAYGGGSGGKQTNNPPPNNFNPAGIGNDFMYDYWQNQYVPGNF